MAAPKTPAKAKPAVTVKGLVILAPDAYKDVEAPKRGRKGAAVDPAYAALTEVIRGLKVGERRPIVEVPEKDMSTWRQRVQSIGKQIGYVVSVSFLPDQGNGRPLVATRKS